MELKLLRAKDAIFRLINDYCSPIHLGDNDSNLYFYDYCESTLERAFNVLEIPDDAIEEFEFYRMWGENNRKIWTACGNIDEMPESWTAQWMYENLGNGRSVCEVLEV